MTSGYISYATHETQHSIFDHIPRLCSNVPSQHQPTMRGEKFFSSVPSNFLPAFSNLYTPFGENLDAKIAFLARCVQFPFLILHYRSYLYSCTIDFIPPFFPLHYFLSLACTMVCRTRADELFEDGDGDGDEEVRVASGW